MTASKSRQPKTAVAPASKHSDVDSWARPASRKAIHTTFVSVSCVVDCNFQNNMMVLLFQLYKMENSIIKIISKSYFNSMFRKSMLLYEESL